MFHAAEIKGQINRISNFPFISQFSVCRFLYALPPGNYASKHAAMNWRTIKRNRKNPQIPHYTKRGRALTIDNGGEYISDQRTSHNHNHSNRRTGLYFVSVHDLWLTVVVLIVGVLAFCIVATWIVCKKSRILAIIKCSAMRYFWGYCIVLIACRHFNGWLSVYAVCPY